MCGTVAKYDPTTKYSRLHESEMHKNTGNASMVLNPEWCSENKGYNTGLTTKHQYGDTNPAGTY
jgi:hypothetical protein